MIMPQRTLERTVGASARPGRPAPLRRLTALLWRKFRQGWMLRIGMAGVTAIGILALAFGILSLESNPRVVLPMAVPGLAPAGRLAGLAVTSGWIAAGAGALLAAALMLYGRSREQALRHGRSREQALRRDNAKLEARLLAYTDLSHAFDTIAVFVRRPDGTIHHWSAGCERLFGFTAAEAVGRAAHELLGTRFPDGGRRTAQETLLRDGDWQSELRHRRRDGTPVIVAAHWILRRGVAATPPKDVPEGSAVVEVHVDATALKAAEAALNAGEARLRLAQDVAGVGTWEWDTEADSFVWSPEQHGLFGTLPATGPPASHEAFLALVHPDDRDQVRAAAFRAFDTGEYETEFRILRPVRGGAAEIRWLIGRGRRIPGHVGRFGPILGVNVDITARKETEERQTLLMREVDHRAKNALAVVQAILRLTRADSPDCFARVVEGRVAALARAQTLLTASRWVGADLIAMLRGELSHFMEEATPSRITLSGPSVMVAPVTAQPLSMALHELATNAAKYGSLSNPGGTLALTWKLDCSGARLRLRWTERGGPAIAGAPKRSSFGSRVIRTTVRDQLSGGVEFDWRPEGLICDIDIPLYRTTAQDVA